MELAAAAAAVLQEEEDEDNLERQLDEVEALRAILGDGDSDADGVETSVVDCVHISGDRLRVRVRLPAAQPLVLVAVLPRGYPSRAPPDLQVTTSTGAPVPASIAEGALNSFANLWADAGGEVMLFDCVAWLEERAKQHAADNDALEARREMARQREAVQRTAQQQEARSLAEGLMGRFLHGDTLTDRKSVFQAHVARLQSPEEVILLLRALKSDRKIARATHNMVAWRCGLSSDNDDDGESAAGRRLAELLALMGADNVLVVVSRWYGGIHLGPDRFKHINNVARALLVAEGFVGGGSEENDSGGQRQQKRTKKKCGSSTAGSSRDTNLNQHPKRSTRKKTKKKKAAAK